MLLFSQKEERSRYFGSPLESVVESDGVPLLVKKCVQLIEEHGLKSEGIYRVSGKKEDILSLQEKYDEGTLWCMHDHINVNLRSTSLYNKNIAVKKWTKLKIWE